MQLILLKRLVLLLLLALTGISGRSSAQTYVGSVEFTSQSALNAWDPQWKSVTGNIYITSLASDVVTSLAPLQNLTTVGGAVIIAENHSLTSLDGLNGLQSAGMLEISFNGSLSNLAGLGALATVSGPVSIVGNASLTTLTALSPALNIGGDLTIRNNPVLAICSATAICNYQRNHSSSTYLNVSGNAGLCSDEAALYEACNGPLPVMLTEFDAMGEGPAVRLRWATATETNASHFDIERSRDGRTWHKAGAVKARGESGNREEYTFTDAVPFTGESLYRLRMNDRDETFSYSRMRSVYVPETKAPVYPNPFSALLSFSVNHAGAFGIAELIDARGNVVYQTAGILPASIPTAQWQPGTYWLKLVDKDGLATQFRIVKTN
ncbi:T9SS type A sorting domain-containing protein [Dyadobacter sp. 676]|uniref:T9SS type A sorting domain-containing protein n=1 Tax=Dyadobacter sp. 676 TaxID=3088362 RepID=A0AAU8FMB1_9BACT